MRVRYRFSVSGCLRLAYSFPIKIPGFTYTFEVDGDGVVTHLNVSTSVPDKSEWPRTTPNPAPGIKLHIQMPNAHFPIVQRDIRAIMGILSIYGVDEISVDDAEEFWEAENDAEKASLSIFSMKRTSKATSPTTWPRVPFDLVARSLMVADRAKDFEAALNFFRKGKLDVKSGYFLDAILDFLFMVETTYANGKFKTTQVELEYLASQELHQLISTSLLESSLLDNVRHHDRIRQSFDQVYRDRSSTEIISHLVKLRGELHHHTSRKSGVWNPTDHTRFGADAYFLQQLCFGIAFAISSPTVFEESTERVYRAQEHESALSKTLVVHRRDA